MEKYRYHIIIFFIRTNTRHITCFNSNSRVLKMSEVRNAISREGMDHHGNFNIESLIKTIND